MALENNSLFTDPETITDLVDKMIVPRMYAIPFAAPFVESDDGNIPLIRESYSDDTDPLAMLPPEGTPEDWEPDAIKVTLGELVSMNTQMRKVKLDFKVDDWNKPNANYATTKAYNQASFIIAKQLERQMITELQTVNNVTTTLFNAKKGAVWSSSSANPLKALRALAGDFGEVGSDLRTVLLNQTNWRELYDFLETDDYDLTYAREHVAPDRAFSQEVLVLKLNVSPQINVVGIHGSFITEGRLIAVGGVQGEPAAQTHYYMNPRHEVTRIPEYEDVPLQVSAYDSIDGDYNHVKLWIDARTVVHHPNAVAYVSTEVV